MASEREFSVYEVRPSEPYEDDEGRHHPTARSRPLFTRSAAQCRGWVLAQPEEWMREHNCIYTIEPVPAMDEAAAAAHRAEVAIETAEGVLPNPLPAARP